MDCKTQPTSYLMIIGAMKAGTTSLYNYLKNHPEICPCITKEPEFFSKNQDHGYKINNYFNLYNFDNKIHKYALEASTGYSKFPFESNVPQTIKNYGLNPKFIYIIRNPFERIISQYNHLHKNDKSFTFDFMYKYLIDYSKYYMQLSQFVKVFQSENILILDFEDLKNNTNETLNQVYDFMSISKSYYPEELKVFNKTTGESRKSILLKNKIDKKLSFLPKSIKNILKKTVRKVYSTNSLKLTKKQKQLIYDDLKDDMNKLKDEYGINTSKWGFD